jgi:hypothetical protein
MNDQTPVLRSRANVPAPTNAIQHDLRMNKALAISKAGDMLPRAYRNQPGAVFLAIEWAEMRNLAILDVLHGVAWVQGKPVIDATLQRALAMAAGYRLQMVAADTTKATVVVSRNGEELGKASFTMDEAKTAGLAGKDNWRKHPVDMLVARATTRAIKWFCPEALLGGAMTDDEIESMNTPAPPVEVATESTATAWLDEPTEPSKLEQSYLEAEIVETEPEPAVEVEPVEPEPEPAPVVEVADDKATAQTRGTAKAVLDRCKGGESWDEIAASLKAESIPLAPVKWTEKQALRIVEIAGLLNVGGANNV